MLAFCWGLESCYLWPAEPILAANTSLFGPLSLGPLALDSRCPTPSGSILFGNSSLPCPVLPTEECDGSITVFTISPSNIRTNIFIVTIYCTFHGGETFVRHNEYTLFRQNRTYINKCLLTYMSPSCPRRRCAIIIIIINSFCNYNQTWHSFVFAFIICTKTQIEGHRNVFLLHLYSIQSSPGLGNLQRIVRPTGSCLRRTAREILSDYIV